MAEERLGKYELRAVLGRGAMGTVYEGWDPVISRKVAIKTVRLPDSSDAETQDELARFKREAQATGRLTHPNIVGVFDYGETNEIAYIVMEFIDGQPLKSMMDKHERFPLAETARVMDQLLAGLQYSHENGVVHRDIKPANVMITRDGRVKIADFGIARIESSSMTQAGTVMGTPAYMSPEQIMGQTVDARTDIYSSGVMLYQLLTGERPFEGSMSAIMHKALNVQPPKPSDLSVTAPAALDAVVARAMGKRPEQRYATAAAFAQALRDAVAQAEAPELDADATMVAPRSGAAPAPQPAAAKTTPPRPPLAPTPAASAPAAARPVTPVVAQPAGGSNMPLIAGGAVAALAVLGGIGWFMTRSSPSSQAPVETQVAAVSPPMASVAPSAPAAVAPPASPVASAPAAAPAAPAATPAPAAAPPVASSPAPAAAPASPPPAESAPTSQASAPAATAKSAAPQPVAEKPVADKPVADTPTPPPPAAAETPAKPPAVVASLVPPIAPVTAAVLRTALANLPCTMVSAQIADGDRLLLDGMAGAGAPDASVRQAIGEIAPTLAASWKVNSFKGPYCAALDVLRPVSVRFSGAEAGLGLALKGNATRLKRNELIIPQLTMPDFSGHLIVDYLSSDGTVTHLIADDGVDLRELTQAGPKTMGPSHTWRANTQVTFGEPDRKLGFVGWAVDEPFGTDMIIAIASSAPLFDTGRLAAGTTADYLRDLQRAIEAARQRGVRVAGQALLVETAAR